MLPASATHRAAVVGAGPSGFYMADQLIRAGFGVDLYEALPTPFGLVRAGVAPDHPKIKSVTRVFERTAEHPALRFFGGVELGRDISREDLLARYEVVVYAIGTPADRRLGIPGEDRPGSVAATDFVAWYNGHPSFEHHRFDLSCERAVVVGNGNVALDVARMLMLDPDELAPTDVADHALAAFGASSVREVVVLGRRGPLQAAFTTPELRELGELRRAEVVVDADELELDEASAAIHEAGTAPVHATRNLELLEDYAHRPSAGRKHRLELRFGWSPIEVLGDAGGAVSGLRVARNRLEPDGNGGVRAFPTSTEQTIPCGLVVRSVGYRGSPLHGVPFDPANCLIRNKHGRVVGDDGTPLVGEYAVGWSKRGPSGVIGTNKRDAADTMARIAEDVAAGRLNRPACAHGADGIERWLRETVPGLVDWPGWQAIDAHERAAGEPRGRPRVKVLSVAEMRSIAGHLPRGSS